MELTTKRYRKGVLLTLLTLILFILILAEIFTYISLNINHNQLDEQLSQASSSSAFGLSIRYDIAAFLRTSTIDSLNIIYSNTTLPLVQNIMNANTTANEIEQLISTNKLYGTDYSDKLGSTIGNYISALESQASSQQLPVSIINGSFSVVQNGPLSVIAMYTALAIVNSSASNSTYPIQVNVTIPVVPNAGESYVAALPPGITTYAPVRITNTQSENTPSPFQEMVTVNSLAYKQYEASNLQNIEFFYANGTIIGSWLDSGNSNTSATTVYWLKILGGISARSTLTVYMGFANLSTNLFNNQTTGEAPALSPTYAKYDDGGNIFIQYFNMSSNPVKYSIIGTSYYSITTANGPTGASQPLLTWTGATTADNAQLASGGSYPSSFIVDAIIKTDGNGYDIGLGATTLSSSVYDGYLADPGSYSNTNFTVWKVTGSGPTLTQLGKLSYTQSGDTWYTLQFTYVDGGKLFGNVSSYSGAVPGGSINTVSATDTTYTSFNSVMIHPRSTLVSYSTYWALILLRSYPPNGVMPVAVVG